MSIFLGLYKRQEWQSDWSVQDSSREKAIFCAYVRFAILVPLIMRERLDQKKNQEGEGNKTKNKITTWRERDKRILKNGI